MAASQRDPEDPEGPSVLVYATALTHTCIRGLSLLEIISHPDSGAADVLLQKRADQHSPPLDCLLAEPPLSWSHGVDVSRLIWDESLSNVAAQLDQG